MEMLMDYHMLFIAVSFCMLFLTFAFFFIIKTNESFIGGMLTAVINWTLCILNSLGFFAIGIIGIDSSGNATITSHYEMYPVYAVFFMLYWFNTVLLIYGAMMLIKNPWKAGEAGIVVE